MNESLNLPDQSSYRVGQPVYIFYKKDKDAPPVASPAIITEKMLMDVWSNGRVINKINYSLKIKADGRRPGEFIEEVKYLKDLRDAKIFNSIAELKKFWLDQVLSKFQAKLDEIELGAKDFFDKNGVSIEEGDFPNDVTDQPQMQSAPKRRELTDDEILKRAEENMSRSLVNLPAHKDSLSSVENDDDESDIGLPVAVAKTEKQQRSTSSGETKIKDLKNLLKDDSNPYDGILGDADVSPISPEEEKFIQEAEKLSKTIKETGKLPEDKIQVNFGLAAKRKKVLPGRS